MFSNKVNNMKTISYELKNIYKDKTDKTGFYIEHRFFDENGINIKYITLS